MSLPVITTQQAAGSRQHSQDAVNTRQPVQQGTEVRQPAAAALITEGPACRGWYTGAPLWGIHSISATKLLIQATVSVIHASTDMTNFHHQQQIAADTE